LEKLKGRDHLGDRGFDGRTILIRILKKLGARISTEFKWFRVESTVI
jgi:hypothetical protein